MFLIYSDKVVLKQWSIAALAKQLPFKEEYFLQDCALFLWRSSIPAKTVIFPEPCKTFFSWASATVLSILFWRLNANYIFCFLAALSFSPCSYWIAADGFLAGSLQGGPFQGLWVFHHKILSVYSGDSTAIAAIASSSSSGKCHRSSTQWYAARWNDFGLAIPAFRSCNLNHLWRLNAAPMQFKYAWCLIMSYVEVLDSDDDEDAAPPLPPPPEVVVEMKDCSGGKL